MSKLERALSMLRAFRTKGILSILIVTTVGCASSAYAPQVVSAPTPDPNCERTLTARVVALDQAFYNNRVGALQAGGMIFALERDVIPTQGQGAKTELTPGQVMLRPDKRPRPIALRMNIGDCMRIHFTNLLAQAPVTRGGAVIQPATRMAGVHVAGMQYIDAVSADSDPGNPRQKIDAGGSWSGANDTFNSNSPSTTVYSGLVLPGASITYTIYAEAEGSYLLYSSGATHGATPTSGSTVGQDGFGGQLSQGLFGSINVQPPGAEYYRSQVTHDDLLHATTGTTPAGQPIIDYQAVFPTGHKYAGIPVLNMLDKNNELVYTDQTAFITGPSAGRFQLTGSPGDIVFSKNPAYPDRLEPYREFTIIYHDDFVTVQAFAAFRSEGPNADMEYTLQAGRDFFAINYGMGGIGPPIWGNRLGVGAMHDCAACKYEEFFLSSWPLGDPAMIVDVPANEQLGPDEKPNGKRATKAFYPDDPSNVYHSYMGDNTKFRVLHGGTNITHVHHQHAHQWLHSPNSDDSNYRDSQMISPGVAYTLDYVYRGSGNKNQTVGDSIFHCHFYPHFAQGMWALWRVHDTFEEGTKLDAYGKPVAGWNRALPDGEIVAGTPTPAVVPIPTIPMAPIPAQTKIVAALHPGDPSRQVGSKIEVDLSQNKSPGYPFFVPGVAGQRAPHPPLDFAVDKDANGNDIVLDGGLPRHLAVAEDGILYEKHNRWDFTKENDKLAAYELPEEGTAVERLAMAANAQRNHPSFLPDGQPSPTPFLLNGQPPIRGAPFAEPGIELDGTPVFRGEENVRRYKAVDIQLDAVLNKKGWHYPQQRITTLWGDVQDTFLGERMPEPLFFRANSGEVVEYWLANLVPAYYELDDFQVRTPTDVLGQHIHLVKFDVLASDGAANGYNYEDGTFAAQEVQGLVETINEAGGLYPGPNGGPQKELELKSIPYFGPGPANVDNPEEPNLWMGAQATVQRWYADPLLNLQGEDRTMRTVFTHDHFGPSTHQQAGLYAGLVIEPNGSGWRDPITGKYFGGIDQTTQQPVPSRLAPPITAFGPGGTQPTKDGGPTSWVADILTNDTLTPWVDDYREFMIEFQDRQLTYKRTSVEPPEQFGTPKPYRRYGVPGAPSNPGGPFGWTDSANAINAPTDPGNPNLPNPQLVTNTFNVGTYSLNYRNEPLDLRVYNPSGGAVPPNSTDLSFVYSSIERADPALNCQPLGPIDRSDTCDSNTTGSGFNFEFPPPFFGAQNFDPYTPLLRTYPGDNVQVRVLVGAHMSPHSFTMQGLRWMFEPVLENSGYRSTQGMGISEHYEMLFKVPYSDRDNKTADYAYVPSSSVTGQTYGNWGILRAYQDQRGDLAPLPDNIPTQVAAQVCAPGAPTRTFNVTAFLARDVLDGALVYNSRGRPGTPGQQQIVDWDALIYVNNDDLNASGKLQTNRKVEPLILRAAAGDCITVNLTNRLPNGALNAGRTSQISSSITLETSHQVGLHAQLVSYDITTSSGVNVGFNPTVTVAPGNTGSATWYAGISEPDGQGNNRYTPVEFGSVSLSPSDPLMQHPFGMLGALIIEPRGSLWCEDNNSKASARVYTQPSGSDCSSPRGPNFREFVVILQDDVANLQFSVGNQVTGTTPAPTTAAPSLFTRALNYRTEPLAYRYKATNWESNTTPNAAPKGISRAVSNSLVLADPETPVFAASAGSPVRFRWLHPAGNAEQSITVAGHVWQEEPYTNASTQIGFNERSQWFGDRDAFGPNNQFDLVISEAGGVAGVKGDYLYRTFIGTEFLTGLWGVMRVGDPDADIVTIVSLECPTLGGTDDCQGASGFAISGVNTVNPNNGRMAAQVAVSDQSGASLGSANVDPVTGKWALTASRGPSFPLLVSSTEGGESTAPGPIVRIQQLGVTPDDVASQQGENVNTGSEDNRARFQSQPIKLTPTDAQD